MLALLFQFLGRGSAVTLCFRTQTPAGVRLRRRSSREPEPTDRSACSGAAASSLKQTHKDKQHQIFTDFIKTPAKQLLLFYFILPPELNLFTAHIFSWLSWPQEAKRNWTSWPSELQNKQKQTKTTDSVKSEKIQTLTNQMSFILRGFFNFVTVCDLTTL